MEASILSLQIWKSVLNFLPLAFVNQVQNQTILTSLLIILVTDTLITGFLVLLWFTGWTLSLSLDIVAVRFLCFQNETYRCVSILLPMIAFSEEWSRSRLKKCDGDLTAVSQTFSLQCYLINLTCWVIAASYIGPVANRLSVLPTTCDGWEWSCLFTFLSDFKTCNYMLPFIGCLLSITLLCNALGGKELEEKINLDIWRNPQELTISLLAGTFVVLFSFVLPPFLSVSSWSALALEVCCSVFRNCTTDSLKTVHINEGCIQTT